MSASSMNKSAQTLMPIDNSTFNNRVTQSGPLVNGQTTTSAFHKVM